MMEQLFYIFCTTLPSHIIPFVLFWNFQWRSRRLALALVTVNVLCKMAVAAYCLSNGLYFRNLELLFAGMGFLIYCCFLRLSPFKMLFTYLLIVDYLLIIRGIAAFLAVQVFSIPIQGWVSSCICILLYGVTLPLLLRFFRQVADLVYRTDAPRLWRIIWLVPAFVTVLALLFTDSYLESSVDSAFFLFCRIGLLVCVFAIYYVLLQSLEGLEQQAALGQQLIFESRLMETQIAEQKKHSQLMVEHMAELRRQRHDLRHQLTAIRGLAGDTNPQLSKYIDNLLDTIPAAPQMYCENQAVNAIVSHYAALCREQGVETDIRLSVPTQTQQITDAELCVIFGNLLENALEACERMGEGRKFLHLGSRVHMGLLTIVMDNSFDGQVRQENGKFRSSKRDDFGVGLTSIQAVARKRGGDARFEAENNVFHSSVYVQI